MGLSFPFPFIDILILPTDADSSTDRIVIDGINGAFLIYDGATLVGRWRSEDFQIGTNLDASSRKIIIDPDVSGNPLIRLLPDAAALAAEIFSDLDAVNTPLLELRSPRISSGPPERDAQLVLYGANAAKGVRPNVVLDVDDGEFQIVREDVYIPGLGYCADASATGDSASVTAETVIATISNFVFRDGRAYKASYGPRARGNTAGDDAIFNLRKTNAAGTLYGEGGRHPIIVANGTINAHGHWFIRRNFGAGDLTATVVLTIQSVLGGGATVHQRATGTTPRYLLIEDVGPANYYQFAFSVT